MRADRIEIAQDDDSPGGVAGGKVAQHLLDEQLRAAVGICGRERMVLVERQTLRLAIDGGRRAEHQLAHARRGHGLQQAQRAVDVAVVVGERHLVGFAHRLQPGEMDDGGAVVAAQHVLHEGAVADVARFADRRPAGDGRHPRQRLGIAVVEIVDDDDVLPGRQQLDRRVGTDVAGAARDQYRHADPSAGRPNRRARPVGQCLYEARRGFNAGGDTVPRLAT